MQHLNTPNCQKYVDILSSVTALRFFFSMVIPIAKRSIDSHIAMEVWPSEETDIS